MPQPAARPDAPSVPGPVAEVVDESANADQQLHQLGWKLQTGALRLKYNSDGELVFQESFWFAGQKEGYVFKSGVEGLGYYEDTAALPRRAKPKRVYTLRDGILGYHVDRPAKLDVAEAEAFKRLGWAQAVMKFEGAVDDAAPETHAPAPGVAPEAAKAPSREPDAASDGGCTWKAAYNFVHRLKQNSKRLSECSEQLRLLLASNDESDKKKLIRLVTESKGKVEDLEMKVSHEQSVTEFETAKTRVTPVTEAELCQIYGSRAREVMDYKVSMGEFQEDQNLPGSRVFLIARDLAETGTDHKKSSLTLAWPCCIVCQWTCDNESRLAEHLDDQERLFMWAQPRHLLQLHSRLSWLYAKRADSKWGSRASRASPRRPRPPCWLAGQARALPDGWGEAKSGGAAREDEEAQEPGRKGGCHDSIGAREGFGCSGSREEDAYRALHYNPAAGSLRRGRGQGAQAVG